MPPLPRKTRTFVIRLWAEYLEQDPPCWRGEIQQLNQSVISYFTDLDELENLIREAAGADELRSKIEKEHL